MVLTEFTGRLPSVGEFQEEPPVGKCCWSSRKRGGGRRGGKKRDPGQEKSPWNAEPKPFPPLLSLLHPLLVKFIIAPPDKAEPLPYQEQAVKVGLEVKGTDNWHAWQHELGAQVVAGRG